ncbi:MAG TPA: DUF3800 domain-containing protein [Gemmatimonadaceae bacterium]|nr:DUF3800 domain-containing protein [Gemmatimonadaceae bacterium]
MPVQVVVDDSGGDGQVFMLMAALIGRAEAMAEFADRWRECLDELPKIRVFKMRDAVKRQGEWRGLRESQRDEKVRRLARTIDRFGFRSLWVGMELEGYREIVGSTQPPPLDKPYSFVFHTMIGAALMDVAQSGERETFDIIFDEHPSLGPRARAAYPIVRGAIDPQNITILPRDPVFRDDKKFLPLQGADLMAWSYRRYAMERSHPLPWLAECFGNTKGSRLSVYLDRARLKQVVDDSYHAATAEDMGDFHRRLRHGD